MDSMSEVLMDVWRGYLKGSWTVDWKDRGMVQVSERMLGVQAVVWAVQWTGLL